MKSTLLATLLTLTAVLISATPRSAFATDMRCTLVSNGKLDTQDRSFLPDNDGGLISSNRDPLPQLGSRFCYASVAVSSEQKMSYRMYIAEQESASGRETEIASTTGFGNLGKTGTAFSVTGSAKSGESFLCTCIMLK